MRDAEELVIGRYPGVQIFPFEQVHDHPGLWVGWHLIQPGDNHLARPSWKSSGEEWKVGERQPSDGCAALDEEFPSRDISHVHRVPPSMPTGA